jgi:hypothetical protein
VDKKKLARHEMLKEMKSKMKGERDKDYNKKHGKKLASVQVVAPEKKIPEALSIAQKLMKVKDSKPTMGEDSSDKVGYPDDKYKNGGKSGTAVSDKERYAYRAKSGETKYGSPEDKYSYLKKQSGAAISEQEAQRLKRLSPSVTDNEEIKDKKRKLMEAFKNSKKR